jgi:hypothetical protein
MVWRALGALLLALLVLPQDAQGQAPWRLDFQHEGLQRVNLRGPHGLDVAHYYMVFEVSNPGEKEVPLAIYFSLETDRSARNQMGGQMVRDLGTAKVIEAVRAADGSRDEEREILGRSELPRTLAPGDKVTGVAVFGPLDKNADGFTVDVLGLRDVIVTRKGSDSFEKTARRIQFARPGDSAGADRAPVKLVKESWVLLSDSP